MAKKKIVKSKKEFSSTKVIISLIVIVILAFGAYLIFKNRSGNNKQAYKGNVTDIVMQNGEIVSYKYNNFQFVKKDNSWYTQIQKGSQPYIIGFTYGPINLEDININFNDNYFPALTTPGSKVYLTFDHDSTNGSYIATAAINLITNMKTVYGINASRACLKNSTSCAGAPIVNCASKPNNAVIEFLESNETSVTYAANCLTIRGQKDDFIRETEKIILNWYGIA